MKRTAWFELINWIIAIKSIITNKTRKYTKRIAVLGLAVTVMTSSLPATAFAEVCVLDAETGEIEVFAKTPEQESGEAAAESVASEEIAVPEELAEQSFLPKKSTEPDWKSEDNEEALKNPAFEGCR